MKEAMTFLRGTKQTQDPGNYTPAGPPDHLSHALGQKSDMLISRLPHCVYHTHFIQFPIQSTDVK